MATGVARTVAQRTAGGVLKAAARTGPGAIMDVAQEAAKGAAKSFDFERRIIGRAKGTGVPKPSRAVVGEPEPGIPKTPDIEFSPGGSKATRDAELDAIQKTTDNTIEGLVRPFDAARGSRFGRWAMGTESQGFRQLFGNTKIGRAFNERVNGLRGIVRSAGDDIFAKVGEKLHLHNIMEARGLQQTGFKARLFELKEKAANMIYDDDGFMQNVLHRGGQVVTDAEGTLKARTHSLSIMENIAYDPVQKRIITKKSYKVQVGEKGKRTDPKRITESMTTIVNEDGSATLRFGGKYRGNEIRISSKQKEVLEDTLTYLHDAGKHTFKKEINIIKGNRAVMGKIAQRSGKKLDAVTDDDILRSIGENEDFLFETFAGKTKWKKYGSNYFLNLQTGRGLARGANYVNRILREAAEANEGLSDAARILAHDQGRVTGGQQQLEKFRNEFADQLLHAGKTSGHYVARPSELVEAYSKGAIKKAVQDDLNDALKAILLSKTYGKLSKADYAAKINKAWGRKAKKAAGRKITFTEAQAFVFEAEEKATGKLLIRQLGIGRGEDAKASLLKWVNEQFFAPLRGFRAGIDFGFMGINTLPMLFIDPVGYGKVWGRVIKTFLRRDKYLEFMNLKSDVISDMTETGIHMSSYGADLYDSLLRPGNSAGILGKIPLGVGNALERVARGVLTPFETSFYTAVDAARISLFEFYTPIWGNLDGPARLAARRQMADFINYSTGGFSTVEAGLTPTQRDIESSWVFFSPRYTRASMGLVSLVFDGSVQGTEARRLLANALTAGTMIYINACEALDVEPNLDPTSGEFFTIPIGGDSVGPGTFYRQLLTLNARMIENPKALYFSDDKPGVQFGEKLFNHPIVKFFRGRTPIGTGFAIDMATGSDYLGHELDGWEEKVQHAATLGVPFWAENMIQGDPYKAGPAGIVSEMLGARSFPRNPYSRRRDMRDELAQNNFNKEQWGDGSWNSLTKAQQEIIEAGSPELRTLDEEVKESKGDRSGGFDTLMEEKFDMIDEVNEEYHRVMVDKILAIESGETPDSLPELWELNQEQQRRKRREKQKMRKDERFIEIDNYYEQLRKEGKIVDQYPDEIMQDYYYPEVIWATERNDGSIDWAARQRLEERFFSAYPGMEAYVNTLQHSWGLYDENTPAVIREGHTYMEKYGEKYFDFTADAVFNMSVSLQKFRAQYEEFRGLNSKDRDIVLSVRTGQRLSGQTGGI